MSTTKRNTYRGKYPNRIKAVWGTTTTGIYGCETNKGERFFFAAREMIAAGYKISHCQLLKLDATQLSFLTASIMEATRRAIAPRQTEFTYVREIGRSSSSNSVTVSATNEADARILAEQKLESKNIRLHVPTNKAPTV